MTLEQLRALMEIAQRAESLAFEYRARGVTASGGLRVGLDDEEVKKARAVFFERADDWQDIAAKALRVVSLQLSPTLKHEGVVE